MPAVLFGIVTLVLVLWLLHAFSRSDPQKMARALKAAGGIIALMIALLLALRGSLFLAVSVGIIGLGLLGWMPFGPAGPGARTQKSARQISRVRSAFVEMELDHDSGAMGGRFLAGRHEGVPLDALDVPTLVDVLADIDDESRALLMAYLDRRAPLWREDVKGDTAAGWKRPSSGGKMTDEEAYQILGVEPGASPEDIGRAHRTLMKKLHPDQGGSTYLAARVNEAKDILIRRHR
jgi:hypothetical protein